MFIKLTEKYQNLKMLNYYLLFILESSCGPCWIIWWAVLDNEYALLHR